MNKKLFEIRKIEWQHIMFGLLIAAVIISFFATYRCLQKNNFINKFHKDEFDYPITQYKPLNDTINNKGLYGKINFALDKALKEKGYIADKLTDTTYMKDSRLLFFVPQTENHIVDVREIRLIGFIPDSTEIEFFHNSNFKRYLQKQKENLDKSYFIIEWKKEEYPPRIKSIKIDNTLGDVPLLNNNWKGQIFLEDPFSQIDKNVVYLIKDNMPIPLFTSNFPIIEFCGAPTKFIPVKIDEWKPNKTHEYQQWYNDMNNIVPSHSKVLRVEYNNKNWVEFLNKGDSIYLSNGTQDTIFMWINNHKQPIPRQVNGYAFPRSFKNMVKLEIKSTKEYIYLSKTPFSVASKSTNNGFAGKRINIKEEYCDLFTRQQLLQLESNLDTTSQNIKLTTNIILSKILEDEIKDYVNKKLFPNKTTQKTKKDEFQMSICLMDISTGEVIAAPYYSNRFSDKKTVAETEIRNFNLVRHHIGSTFKPLLAFAAAAKYPSLSKFSLTNLVERTDDCCLIGYKVPHYGKGNDLFWNTYNSKSRINFLGHSHDNYPIALTMLALTENDSNPADIILFNLLNAQKLDNEKINNLPKLLGNNDLTRIPNYYKKKEILFNEEKVKAKLEESSFANLLYNLYDIEMGSRDVNNWSLTADTMSWRYLKGNTLKLYSLYPDKLNLQLDLINNFIDFENFVLGQGNNFWNNVKLAEAYSRLLSKKAVKATFLKGNDSIPDLFKDNGMFNHISHYDFKRTKQEIENAWISFMEDWREAVAQTKRDDKKNPTHKGGTLHEAYKKFKDSFKDNANDFNKYHFYCKTGTPQKYNINEHSKRSKEDGTVYLSETLWRDEGVFVFGITNKDDNNPKGIVGVIYIKRISDKKPTTSIEGATARDFLTDERFKKIMFYNKNRFQ